MKTSIEIYDKGYTRIEIEHDDPLPCPFCGQDEPDVEMESVEDDIPRGIVACADCGATVAGKISSLRVTPNRPNASWEENAIIDAVARWNRRSSVVRKRYED